jgi:sensor domain CHASE-containing protein
MKKHITLNNMAWALAFLVPLVIATMLCTACLNLQNKIHEKQEMQKDVKNMFESLDKSLVLERKYLDTVNKQWVFEYSVK